MQASHACWLCKQRTKDVLGNRNDMKIDIMQLIKHSSPVDVAKFSHFCCWKNKECKTCKWITVEELYNQRHWPPSTGCSAYRVASHQRKFNWLRKWFELKFVASSSKPQTRDSSIWLWVRTQQDFNIQQSPAKVILYNHTHGPVTQIQDFLRMNKTTAPKTRHIKRNLHKYFTLGYWQQNIREIIRI